MNPSRQIPLRMCEIHKVQKLGLNKTPFGTDALLYKSYPERLYLFLLSSLPRIQTILEIGVRGGASLCFWSLLHPQALEVGANIVQIKQPSGVSLAYLSRSNFCFVKGVKPGCLKRPCP